ncbi:hypothetical protein BN946_scf184925.g6 [Trametes cinnabarina]|uniref:Uncharacterized protein n=1 Tax=Pycnoporus cinnabarinus TaxID=5643 RepID=A0A060SW32_PYCCI|nr:hypothetical protein BN946_scf184925.g6 [Trametes cinnabarina]
MSAADAVKQLEQQLEQLKKKVAEEAEHKRQQEEVARKREEERAQAKKRKAPESDDESDSGEEVEQEPGLLVPRRGCERCREKGVRCAFRPGKRNSTCVECQRLKIAPCVGVKGLSDPELHTLFVWLTVVLLAFQIQSSSSINVKIVSFFNSSHYWGGQLDIIRVQLKLKSKLKMHTTTRWYSLILQAMSVQKHWYALIELYLHDDAQHSLNGYSVIKTDVIKAVIDPAHWQCNAQLIRMCKPLIDAIGNLESWDMTLADCTLELIDTACQVATLTIEQTDDLGFTWHAQHIIRKGFYDMNTDLHWFALFLHPLGWQLTISSAEHSRTVKDAYYIALDLTKCWN